MAYEKRGYHQTRNAEFRLCPDEHVGKVHAVTRALYLGALVGSAVMTGAAAAVASFALMPVGALYGSASESVEAGHGGAKVSGAGLAGGAMVGSELLADGDDVGPVEGVDSREVLFDVAERLLPILLFR